MKAALLAMTGFKTIEAGEPEPPVEGEEGEEVGLDDNELMVPLHTEVREGEEGGVCKVALGWGAVSGKGLVRGCSCKLCSCRTGERKSNSYALAAAAAKQGKNLAPSSHLPSPILCAQVVHIPFAHNGVFPGIFIFTQVWDE